MTAPPETTIELAIKLASASAQHFEWVLSTCATELADACGQSNTIGAHLALRGLAARIREWRDQGGRPSTSDCAMWYANQGDIQARRLQVREFREAFLAIALRLLANIP